MPGDDEAEAAEAAAGAVNFKMSFKIPEFHADPHRHPDESWSQHKINMKMAYKVAGIEYKRLQESQRVAHLLQSLQGKARKFLELNPGLLERPLAEVREALEKKFGKPRLAGLRTLSNIVQKPGELVMEYVARLRQATASIPDIMGHPEVMTAAEYNALSPERKAQVLTQEEYNRDKNAYESATEHIIMPQFMSGLRPELKVAVAHARAHTLKDAIKAAEEHEQYLETYGNLDSSMGEIHLMEAKSDVVKGAAEQLKRLNKPSSMQGQRSSKLAVPVRGGAERETRVCHYCHRSGHLKRDCRQYARDQERGAAGPRSRYHDTGSRPSMRPRMSHMQHQGTTRPGEGNPRDSGKRYETTGGSTWLRNVPKNGGRPPQRGGLQVPAPIPMPRRQL